MINPRKDTRSDKLMLRIESLEKELDAFNKKYRELQAKYKIAIETIQKIDPTK